MSATVSNMQLGGVQVDFLYSEYVANSGPIGLKTSELKSLLTGYTFALFTLGNYEGQGQGTISTWAGTQIVLASKINEVSGNNGFLQFLVVYYSNVSFVVHIYSPTYLNTSDKINVSFGNLGYSPTLNIYGIKI